MPLQPTVKLLIDGQFIDSKTKDWIEVKNPATQVGCSSGRGRGRGQGGALLLLRRAGRCPCWACLFKGQPHPCGQGGLWLPSCRPLHLLLAFCTALPFCPAFSVLLLFTPPLTSHMLQEVVSRLPLCTAEEFNAAVQSARDAFPRWRATPVPQRARVMLKLQVGGWAGLCGWVGWRGAAQHGLLVSPCLLGCRQGSSLQLASARAAWHKG